MKNSPRERWNLPETLDAVSAVGVEPRDGRTHRLGRPLHGLRQTVRQSARGGEGMEKVGRPPDTGPPSEVLADRSHLRGGLIEVESNGRRLENVERERRHHERAGGPDRIEERLDDGLRAVLDSAQVR